MTDREAFEAWISGPPYECEVTRFPEGSAWPGNYQDPSVDLAWFAWQAATPAWHDAQETIALQLELASAKEAYLNACKLVADMHAAAVGEVTGPRLGVVEDVAAIKAERDAAMKDAERYRWLTRTSDTNKFMVCDTDTQILYFGWEADEAIDEAIAKAEGKKS